MCKSSDAGKKSSIKRELIFAAKGNVWAQILIAVWSTITSLIMNVGAACSVIICNRFYCTIGL